jgi:carbonic anhydrase
MWEGDRIKGLILGVEEWEKDKEHSTPHTDINPSKVLDELVAGYERYKDGQMEHPHTGQSDLKKLASGQTPKACILGCADSRVPPEVIFDQGLGDLFVVRVAGNFADDDNQASLEYAVQHFDPPPALIVVLGHERCGAIQGAAISFDPASTSSNDWKKFYEHGTPSEKLVALVTQLKPAIDSTKPAGPLTTPEAYAKRIDDAVRQNVRDNVAILQGNKEIKKSGAFVIGARYDLDSGEIEWLTPKPNGSIE